MNSAAVSALLIHLLGLSLISFGGIPSVLPDLRHFVVIENGWLSDRDFANCFAIVQVLPGPNMILMMGFIGWQVGGLRLPSRARSRYSRRSAILCFAVFRISERFRDKAWQRVVRRGIAPVTIGARHRRRDMWSRWPATRDG